MTFEHEYDVFVETSHQALEQPAGRDWILFSPLACCLQRKTVNWRHNSMYLHGCMPHGYDLRRFVQNVNHVSFSPCPLHANGPVEPGGSFAEAEQQLIEIIDLDNTHLEAKYELGPSNSDRIIHNLSDRPLSSREYFLLLFVLKLDYPSTKPMPSNIV